MDKASSEKRPFDSAHYARIIAAAVPELRGAPVRWVNEEGQFNDALLVGEQFIFRFPRYQDGIALLRREVAFLQGIRGHTTLPVPDPIFVNLEGDTLGEVFMGYPLLAGEPLWRPAILGQTDERVLDRWARQLAGFLQELHGITLSELGGDWPLLDSAAEWQTMFDEIQMHLFPLMRADARKAAAAHYETYLADPVLQQFQPAPRHGDYGSGNILFDPGTMAISGIIDFGFAAVGDPALDIAAASTLGEPLFGRFAAAYPAIDSMLPRAQFYRGTYALDEALHGFKSGDREAFEAGMAAYV